MKTLIVGNGFDIDHGLPTKYKDFLYFIEEVKWVKELGDDFAENAYLFNTELKQYLYNLLKDSQCLGFGKR